MKKITMSMSSSVEFCKGYNQAVDEINQRMMRPVTCISIRKCFPNQIELGKNYYLDIDSIVILDGDAYANIYSLDTNDEYSKIAFMSLSHFKSETEE